MSAGRRGSSRPIVVETDSGLSLVKLRGSGQGTGALVAEIIVAELAEKLGLCVPPRSLVSLPKGIPTEDWDDELEDVLVGSIGLNLGFDYLEGAREVHKDEAGSIDPDIQSTILWLDRLVMNPDRTERNPNLLHWADGIWLIDHGATLGFQYRWSQVTEESPRDPWSTPEPHLFDRIVSISDLKMADERLAQRLTKTILNDAVRAVPDAFLEPLVQNQSPAAEVADHHVDFNEVRQAYVSYLWKRLSAPRPFLNSYDFRNVRKKARLPDWLTGMSQGSKPKDST